MRDLTEDMELLSGALTALNEKKGTDLTAYLDQLPAPIYLTDAQGLVTYFNPACTGFSGRTPAVGKDRWCVTWKLYTDGGEFLPHDQCPMAEAIRQGRPIRGVSAVAERPDGTRVNFLPFPTPLFAPDGALTGAVNMLIDVTEARQQEEMRSQAARCIRLAYGTNDDQVRATLLTMAQEFEEGAAMLETARSRNQQ